MNKTNQAWRDVKMNAQFEDKGFYDWYSSVEIDSLKLKQKSRKYKTSGNRSNIKNFQDGTHKWTYPRVASITSIRLIFNWKPQKANFFSWDKNNDQRSKYSLGMAPQYNLAIGPRMLKNLGAMLNKALRPKFNPWSLLSLLNRRMQPVMRP